MNKCQACGADMKVVPAGVSKRTGKPYEAFEVCEKGCRKPSLANDKHDEMMGELQSITQGLRKIWELIDERLPSNEDNK